MSLERVVEKAWEGFGKPFTKGMMGGLIVGLFPVYVGLSVYYHNRREREEEERLRREGWSKDEMKAYFNRKVEESLRKHGITGWLPAFSLLAGAGFGGILGVSTWYDAVSIAQRQGDPTDVVILALANAGLSALLPYTLKEEEK